jgi:DNA-binding Xre family transcriptional regulator
MKIASQVKIIFLEIASAMVELRVREVAERKGISNPLALSKESGIAYANCHKIWNNQQKMIGLDTLDRLCAALDCEPGDILVRLGDKKARSTR